MSASPQNPRSRLDSAVPNRLPAWSPRPVWEGLAVALLAVTVAIYGSIVVGREGADRAPLLGMREGLELLRVERDVSIAAAAYDATLTLHMYEGGHAEELARRGETLRRSMLDAAARLDSIAPSDSWNPTHEHMREAVGTALATFDRPSSSNERSSWLTEFLYDFKRVIPTDNLGEWTALLEVATWSQEVPLVLEEYLEVAMAREWQRTRRAPADSDLIESYNTSLASMRQLRESHGAEAETYTPFEEYILPDLADETDTLTAGLVAALAAHAGVRRHESDMPYLLSLTEEHGFESIQEIYARWNVWAPELAEIGERIRSHAIDRLDVAIAASRRRSAIAKYGGMASILLGIVFAVRLIRSRLRVDRHLRSALEEDALTGLSNRYLLFSTAPVRLADPALPSFALIHVDLDDFKSINDDFGHHIGDQALVAFAGALRGAVRSSTDLVCRVGGDEFVVLLQRLDDPEAGAEEVIARLRTALEQPIDLGVAELRLHFTAGVAVAHEEVDLEELLVEADLALLDAKERGRDIARFFRRKLGRRMIHELSTALGNGEVQCAFQPQLDLSTGAVVGLEALARWQRDDRIQVPTRSLIDALEWLGASRKWLRAAMQDIEEAWRTCGDRVEGRVWVNLMGCDVEEATAEELLEIIGSTAVPLDRLGVEITEAVGRSKLDKVVALLERLREEGLAVALDDVGDDRVPLLHVTDLPIDLVKLDRCVITGIDSQPPLRAVVRSLREMCDRLELEILAEGVETPEEEAVLRRLGLRYVQGFLFARPVGVSALDAWLDDRASVAAADFVA